MILYNEIHEQPSVIRRLLENETGSIRQIIASLHRSGGQTAYNYLLIAARGSSDNAARYAQYLFGARNRLPVALATPSLFSLYRQPPDLTGALLLGISQSGKSPDIVSVNAEGKRQGRPTLAITNVADSPLAQASDYVIHLNAGPEKAIAATKTYTSSLGALALLSAARSGEVESLEQLQQVPEWMERCLDRIETYLPRIERYRYMSHCIVIGRGYNYATAFEIALKIKELTRTITEPYSSADFRHGPIAMVTEGFPVIVVAPGGAVSADVSDLIDEVKRRGAELLIVSEQESLLEKADLPLPIPAGIPEWLTPLVAVIPGQLFSMALAQARGLNPDQPLGLTKVTETL